MYYNRDFILSLPLEKAQGVVIHEVLHVFFRHLTRFEEGMKNPK
jgi:predicted metal-dependent peptidase